MLVVSLLLASEFIGLFPGKQNSGLVQRKVIAEALAVHIALEMESPDSTKRAEILRTAVSRNEIIQSVAVRQTNGAIVDSYGSHNLHWTLKPDQQSTATQVRVPLFNESRQVAAVEISFQAPGAGKSLWAKRGSFVSVVFFVAIFGFIAFCFFLKRTLKELDPDAVIPERVRTALDTLAEGLLIVNSDGQIVFSNAAFASATGLTPSDLVGKSATSLNWEQTDSGQLPWQSILDGADMQSGTSVKLRTGYQQLSTFTVNATAIAGRADEIRGALITFNDVTEIEIKHAELTHALVKLEKSQLEITRQNEELEYLATRDPLTGSLNRRSFFNGFDALFAEARESGEELTCVMTDIDHFKSVNDTHGHGVGDDVIKYLADTLTEHSRPNDLVGRFGGEEFCIVMPSTSLTQGYEIAERIRQAIEKGVGADFFDIVQITASFGVASIRSGAEKPNDMVEQADQALYHSKENGRNQVTNFGRSMGATSATGDTAKPATPIIAIKASDADVKPAAEKPSVPVLAIKPTPSDKGAITATPVLNTSPSKTDKAPDEKPSVPVLTIREPAATTEAIAANQDGAGANTGTNLDRNLLLDRIEQALRHAELKDRLVSVLILDAAAIQRISDTLGHAVKEKLYRAIVARLKRTMNLNEVIKLTGGGKHAFSIARNSDTEICLTINGLKQRDDTEAIIETLLYAFRRTLSVDGHEIYVALDIGVGIYPAHGKTADLLVRNASIAMREARDNVGQNNVHYYSNEISERYINQIRLETDLHQALFRNELFIVYQPKVDLRSGNIIAMEALIRWKHAELGIVSPGIFIPIAEETGLIDSISHWVTRVVCAQISNWRDAGHNNVSVAVNISPIEMRNDNLSDNILNAIREFDIPPQSLEVEVTESVAMEDMSKAISTLRKLDRAGVRVAIDDFGTGFASLSYLKLFPITKVKIDRSFVSDFSKNPADARIVSGVIAMSHSLGVKVICEGIEEEAQLRFIQDHHCDEVQGNLISLPLQRKEATHLLNNQSKIRRLIKDYRVADIGLAAVTTTGENTVITGVLNSFPSDGDPDRLTAESA
jgi:diguanylate cyclase (GGDEF)-like protein/PAS domain S-box-containing protein